MQVAKLLVGVAQILGLVRTVETQIADVNNGVRVGLLDVPEHGAPVLLRLGRTT